MKNESGIHPLGDRVLIKPEEIEKVTEGGIIIPESESDKYSMAQSIGYVVAIGPDAWIDHVERSPHGTKTRGFSQPFAKPGDRVCFAKYGGLQVPGMDGESYRIMNDVDITAKVEEGVDFTDWKSRKSMRSQV